MPESLTDCLTASKKQLVDEQLCEDARRAKAQLGRRKTASIIGLVALALSAAFVAAATVARAVDCHSGENGLRDCRDRQGMHFVLMLTASIMFIMSVTGFLVGRFILCKLPQKSHSNRDAVGF